MKIWLILTIAVITLKVQAQTSIYHPFPDSNATWNVRYYERCSFGGRADISYSYIISGDTILSGVTFHKLYIPYNNIIFCSGCCQPPLLGYKGALRQDTLSKKVYYVHPDSITVKLLYDFNLNVGDTLISYSTFSSGVVILSIDSVLIGTTYRKRWITDSTYYCPEYIIEGIGSTAGLLEPLAYSSCFGNVDDLPEYHLTCFSQNGMALFPDSTTNCITITDVANVSEQLSSVEIYPNPFHSVAAFRINSEAKNSELKIYNAIGVLVLKETIKNQSTIIYRNFLTEGIYFYQLINNEGFTKSGRFIIE